MSTFHSTGAMKAYQQVNTYGSVESADPHGLIVMLYNGLLDKLALAKGHISRAQVAEKCGAISKAIAILDELRFSLDKKAGGDIALHLDDLYDYMQRRLVEANISNDESILDEVGSLTRDIRTAWVAIPEHFRQ